MMNYSNALYQNTGEVRAFNDIVQNYSKKQQNKNNTFLVLDIGANKGNYAKACIEKIITITSLSNSFKWYSFEPSPETFKKCTDTLQNFKCQSNTSCTQRQNWNFKIPSLKSRIS